MSFLKNIPRATAPAAIGSLVSLAAQGIFALFLLKLFDAKAVGVFSVVSQIAFCWATLALAQSPVSLLANHQHDPHQAAAVAWRQSLWRMFWLAPLMLLALYWSQSHGNALLPRHTAAPAAAVSSWYGWRDSAGWVSLIAVTQMSWLLAQSLTLRTQGPQAIALVRLVPPVLAALVAWAGAQGLGAAQANTLLLASLLGYSAGMLWILPAAGKWQHHPITTTKAVLPMHTGTSDPRSTRLKMLHTLTDVLCSTALAIQWQSLYGTEQAGYLLVLLRVFGFIPALVHTAWAQALISRPHEQKLSSLWVAIGSSAVIVLLVLCLEAALHGQWLEPSWQNLRTYVWPLAFWQMAACLNAAHAHLPFWRSRTRQSSQQSIVINAIMVALLLINHIAAITATAHLQWVSGFMVMALSLQTLYFMRPRTQTHSKS